MNLQLYCSEPRAVESPRSSGRAIRIEPFSVPIDLVLDGVINRQSIHRRDQLVPGTNGALAGALEIRFTLAKLIATHKVRAIAVGNGAGSEATMAIRCRPAPTLLHIISFVERVTYSQSSSTANNDAGMNL
jgi:hypothetical protein